MGRAERRHKQQQHTGFLHQEKRWMAHIREMVPKIYASVVLLMHRRYHMGYEEIYNFLVDMQDLWQADGDNGFDIVKVCAEETGINLLSKVTADAAGIKEGDHENYEGVEM